MIHFSRNVELKKPLVCLPSQLNSENRWDVLRSNCLYYLLFDYLSVKRVALFMIVDCLSLHLKRERVCPLVLMGLSAL